MNTNETKKILRNSKSLTDIFPNGASSEQLTRFGWLIFGCNTRLWKDYKHTPKAVKRLDVIHQAWSMMISFHVYNGLYNFFKQDNKHGYKSYYEEYISLGGDKETFMKDINTQHEYLKKLSIIKNIGEDYEGNVYNSVLKMDETVIGIKLPT